MNKHERLCRSICVREGLTVIGIDTSRRHLHVQCAEGNVVFPKTPSDYRWQQNARSVARRVAANGPG